MALTFEQLRHDFLVGDRLVQPSLNRIRGPAGEVRVEPKVMAVLVCLAEHAGDVVSRSALYDSVWGRTIVTDQALTNCISELRQHLGDDRVEPRYIETVPKRGYRLIAPVAPAAPAAGGSDTPARRGRLPALVAVGALVFVGAILLWRAPDGDGYEPLPSVVSVPFDNVRGDASIDYLRLALPDEITTLLTQSPQLAVRPFEPGTGSEPLAEARARTAAYVVDGHFYLEAEDRLSIAIEALDVAHERLVWRARITAPAGDLLEMREDIAERVRGGLLPALGAAPAVAMPEPSNAAAYRLYLHSLAISRDAEPNLHGIEMLEQAVRIDPAFAAAWAALAERYNYDATYGNGGPEARNRSREAALRALEEDPNRISAAQQLVVLQVESGELANAYRQAREMLDRRGRSADAHFALAFVLRYAGMLEDAERHCDAAAALDPHNYAWRSCALAFLTDGKLVRAAEFVALDEGADWSNLVSVLIGMRQQDRAEALRHARALPPEGADRRFLVACLEGNTAAMEASAAAFEHRWRRLHDPEPPYHIGAALAWCGRTGQALGMLSHAIEGGYCAWPALDRDPVWRPLRSNPELQRLRAEAMACRERFRNAIAAEGPLLTRAAASRIDSAAPGAVSATGTLRSRRRPRLRTASGSGGSRRRTA